MKELASSSTIILRPTRGLAALNLRDLWVYRELIYFMTWRDLKVRYKQTVLGVSWAVLQPFLQMVVFSIFFGELAKMPTDNDIPYPLFAYAALLPFTLFTKALNDASRSLVGHQNMVTKIYFPRLIMPLASVLGGVVDFVIAFAVLLGLMAYYTLTGIYRVAFSWAWLALPLFTLLALVAALGVALWLSALYVQYRDVGYVLPFLAEVWKFVSPVVYSAAMVPLAWRVIYALNPMAGVINGFRWALLDAATPSAGALAASTGVALLLLVSGLVYFKRMERTFADTI
ncbi:MAG: ABC transporter permease [Chloroflexota bacterium]